MEMNMVRERGRKEVMKLREIETEMSLRCCSMPKTWCGERLMRLARGDKKKDL